MKRNRQIWALAGALLLAAAASSQENPLAAALAQLPDPPAPTNAACPNYAMPIVAPKPNKSAVLAFRPSPATDFKLIVINPCAPPAAPQTAPPSGPLAPDAENTLNDTLLMQTSATPRAAVEELRAENAASGQLKAKGKR